MNAKDIVCFAKDIRETCMTKDPFALCEAFGIHVVIQPSSIRGFKAHTIQMEGYPTVISINGAYTEESQAVLCAHELGHALLHRGRLINYFDNVRAKDIHTKYEYEANLFALALLSCEEDFNIPFVEMSDSVVKYVLDYNIHLKE